MLCIDNQESGDYKSQSWFNLLKCKVKSETHFQSGGGGITPPLSQRNLTNFGKNYA